MIKMLFQSTVSQKDIFQAVVGVIQVQATELDQEDGIKAAMRSANINLARAAALLSLW